MGKQILGILLLLTKGSHGAADRSGRGCKQTFDSLYAPEESASVKLQKNRQKSLLLLNSSVVADWQNSNLIKPKTLI
jgi:hypothetical protein